MFKPTIHWKPSEVTLHYKILSLRCQWLTSFVSNHRSSLPFNHLPSKFPFIKSFTNSLVSSTFHLIHPFFQTPIHNTASLQQPLIYSTTPPCNHFPSSTPATTARSRSSLGFKRHNWSQSLSTTLALVSSMNLCRGQFT